ncbi:hypothetical protein GCM10007941_33650 [Amphritea balenae]|nr:hypothetical protein GCM10007941_33650 [Amphritea balenae]
MKTTSPKQQSNRKLHQQRILARIERNLSELTDVHESNLHLDLTTDFDMQHIDTNAPAANTPVFNL